MIAVRGGHFRDLLRLLRDTVVRATPLPTLPVPPAVIAHTINAAPRFSADSTGRCPLARRNSRVRATALPSTEATPVNRLARFLDSHFVLYFINADEWYDIHPLIRDEVAEVVQAATPTPF